MPRGGGTKFYYYTTNLQYNVAKPILMKNGSITVKEVVAGYQQLMYCGVVIDGVFTEITKLYNDFVASYDATTNTLEVKITGPTSGYTNEPAYIVTDIEQVI